MKVVCCCVLILYFDTILTLKICHVFTAAASRKGKGKKAATASTATEDVSDFGKAVAALKSEGGKKKKRNPKVFNKLCQP